LLFPFLATWLPGLMLWGSLGKVFTPALTHAWWISEPRKRGRCLWGDL
jgi:hypothetical protein